MEDLEKIKKLFDFVTAWREFIWMWAVVIFICATILDILWTFYIRRVNSLKAKSAAIFSGALYLVAGTIVISYTHNAFYILAASLGATVGTYLSVKFESNKNKNKPNKKSYKITDESGKFIGQYYLEEVEHEPLEK